MALVILSARPPLNPTRIPTASGSQRRAYLLPGDRQRGADASAADDEGHPPISPGSSDLASDERHDAIRVYRGGKGLPGNNLMLSHVNIR